MSSCCLQVLANKTRSTVCEVAAGDGFRTEVTPCLCPSDAGIVRRNMVSELEMAGGYDIYSSAARCVRDTHYVADFKLNHLCQGMWDLNATHQNTADG